MNADQSRQIDRVFEVFANDLDRILSDNLYEIIIHGSYALGDFRPGQGDVDYIVATRNDVDPSEAEALFALHDSYRAQTTGILRQLEGTFYPLAVLARPGNSFRGVYIGTGRAGWRIIDSVQNGWFDFILAADCGIKLLGNPIHIYRPTREEIQAELRRDHRSFSDCIQKEGAISHGLYYAIIHWCARTLYYLHANTVSSKGSACEWCASQNEFARYSKLFDAAADQRYPYGDAPSGFTTGLLPGLLSLVRGRI